MLKLILNRGLLLAAGFKVDKFDPKDYKAMCSLIKQKYPTYNQAIQLHKDIRLLDQNGKLIGRYSASEARKKASTLKKDIVLINETADPAICKAYNFRQSILKKFYDQVVIKRNQQLLRKATTSRQLKISINLTENQMQIKSKQIVQLSKKNSKVRIYAVTKASQQQVALSKFDYLKSLIQNKCIIERDVKVEDYKDDEQQQYELKKKANQGEPIKSFSMIVRSKQNQFTALLNESSEKDPDHAIEIFLKRYYRQEDVQMRDLRADADVKISEFDDISRSVLTQQDKPKNYKAQKKQLKKESKQGKQQEGDKQEKKQVFHKSDIVVEKEYQQWLVKNSYVEKQAKARVLNQRLKRILEMK